MPLLFPSRLLGRTRTEVLDIAWAVRRLLRWNPVLPQNALRQRGPSQGTDRVDQGGEGVGALS
jgi:hypothetical protein